MKSMQFLYVRNIFLLNFSFTVQAFRHISLLQVLHKTNDPVIQDQNTDCACGKRKEDPIELLTKGRILIAN